MAARPDRIVANLYDSTGNDTYSASPAQGLADRNWLLADVSQFEEINATASTGTDVATLLRLDRRRSFRCPGRLRPHVRFGIPEPRQRALIRVTGIASTGRDVAIIEGNHRGGCSSR